MAHEEIEMKVESNRIFISDLPETATKDEIQNAFGNYGEVTSIEIKERKELGQKNTTLFFAYVTINIDAKSLNSCFNDFSKGKWLGQYVVLQLARESFLERLKRERETNENKNTPKNENNNEPSKSIFEYKTSIPIKKATVPEKKLNGLSKVTPKKYVSSESDSSSSESEKEGKKPVILKNKDKTNSINLTHELTELDPDLIIKNNRGKIQISKTLKIESVGKEPIIKIEKQSKKASLNTSAANLKRLESLKNLKQGYQNQKSLIQAALSNVDSKPKNKIIFDDASESVYSKQKKGVNKKSKKVAESKEDKKSLFNESESEEEDEFQPTFSVKEHFQGKDGQKLLELQSKYKNDKRFTLDKRFLDESEQGEHNIQSDLKDNEDLDEDMSLEEEKKREYAILEAVLGKKIRPTADEHSLSKRKSMLRFDPSQPEHSKYEIPKPPPEKKEKKRKRKNSETEVTEEKKAEEKSAPEVSKEAFFKVSDDLKETFQEKKEFSLLSMFGQYEEKDGHMDEEAAGPTTSINNKYQQEKNPFKYDSSDDEDETEDIPLQSNITETEKDVSDNFRKLETTRKSTSWTDPFFFKLDDYRLQEGFDFVEKMKTEESTEFTKLRRDLKGIVRAKVRNNLRKNRPFKKKLGGNRKKKVLRMKKAMKR